MLKPYVAALLLSALASTASANSHKETGKRGDLPVARAQPPGPPLPLGPQGGPLPSQAALPADAPPHARLGECYARLRIPARTESYTEQVMVEPERVERRAIPPRYEKRPREVVVREGARRTETISPVYETVTEQVVVRPAYEQTIVEPATLSTVRETVTVAPAAMVWKAVHSPLHPAPVWCLIEEPARTTTVDRTVVVKPERTRVISHPPQFAAVPRQVLRRPAATREIVVPPEVRTVLVDELVEPGRTEEVRIPARFETVTKTRVIGSDRSEWTRVLCQAAATPHKIKAVQSALTRRGYYSGSIDGLYGPATADAVKRFQQAQRLEHSGFLSVPTLERLGVPL